MVVDEASRKLIDNVVNEDDILNENITSTALSPGRLRRNPRLTELQTSS